jgi:hypothetical protein
MQKGWIALLLLFTVFAAAAAGCGNKPTDGNLGLAGKKPDEYQADNNNSTQNRDPRMEGYVVKEEDGRILVVDPLPKDFSSSGGVKEFYDAIWFSDAPPDVQIGHKVRVWFDMVEESYPGQSRAIKVLILTDNNPRHSDLSEAEAIREVLQAHQSERVPVVKKAEYDEKSDTWNVLIRQEDTDLNVKVEDKT